MTAHTNLVNDVLVTLSEAGALAWPNNTGAVQVGERFIRYGFKGSHDVLGVLPGGRAIGVEVKVGRDRPSADQQRFHSAFAARGGLSVVARSVDDVRAALEAR